MARRPNYGFEKRQKELAKQQKKEEKAEKKRLRKEAGLDGAEIDWGAGADEGAEGEHNGDDRDAG